MEKVYSISELARKLGIAPRKISDLFYFRKLDEAQCPMVGMRRIIPESYVATVKRVLRETGAFDRDPVPCPQ